MQIPQADAWALAQPFDWPGLLLPADSARVVWVPVDPRSGAVQLQTPWPGVATLQVAAGNKGLPPTDPSQILAGGNEESLYIPVWEFAAKAGGAPLRVPAHDGRVLPGSWPIQPVLAGARQASWLWMGLVLLFCVGLLFKQLNFMIGFKLLTGGTSALLVQLLGLGAAIPVVWLGYTCLARSLREATQTAAAGALSLPPATTLQPLCRSLAVVLAVLGVWTLAAALATFQNQSVLFRNLLLLQAGLSVLSAYLALRAGSDPYREPERITPGRAQETTQTVLLVSCGALALGLLAHAYEAPLAMLTPGSQPLALGDQFYQVGCKWGANLGALLAARTYGRAFPIALSLSVNTLASALWGDRFSFMLTFPVLLLTLLIEARNSPAPSVIGALQLTWKATVAGLVGKIVGRCLGFLFLGEEGMVVMELVLERLFFILMLTRRKA